LAPVALDALRRVHVGQAAEKLKLGSAYADKGFVFTNEVGEPLDLDVPTKAFAGVARKAGLRGVRLHDLRHSAATWALAGGSDVRTVSALLGHSAPSTTLNVYGHVVAGLQSRAVDGLGDTLARARARRAAGETSLTPTDCNQNATNGENRKAV
jgi:integrase